GGCAALTGELERRVVEGGADLRLQHDVIAIEQADGAVSGVRVRAKTTGDEALLRAPMVISNIGPWATRRLVAIPEGAAVHAGAPGVVSPRERIPLPGGEH